MKGHLTVCLVCLLGLSIATCSPALAESGSNTNEIRLVYSVDEPTIEASVEGPLSPEGFGKIYKSITVPGLTYRIVSGEPVLPVKTAKILIPYGDEFQGIEVIPGGEQYLGKILIEPGQDPVPSCYVKENFSELETTEPSEAIYESSDLYPGEFYSVVAIQNKRGYKILYVHLYPVQYVPKTGDVYYYSTFEVKVKTAPSETLDVGLFRGAPQDRLAVERVVDNPEKVATYDQPVMMTGRSALLNGDFDYLIITTQNLKEAPGPYNFQALAEQKNEKGLSAAIVTVEDIYAAYKYSVRDRSDKAGMIREFITDAYNKNNVTYVLLGGDGDGSTVGGETQVGFVPSKGLWAPEGYEPDSSSCGSNTPNVISDLYYACLNGSYDANRNGIYGEPDDNPDLLAEVYVGRAPVDNYKELSNFVRKTIAYDSTNSTDPHLTSAWMVGQYLEVLGGGDYTGELDNEGCWGGNYTDEVAVLFPEDFHVWTLYDRNYSGSGCDCDQLNWPKWELIDLINENLHIINHVGTANFCDIVAYVMKMGYNDADALKNDKYFFGYSQAGYAGSFDNRGPEGVYLPHDCVLEHFVTGEGGAFAFIGDSRYALLRPNVSHSPSQGFNVEFWNQVFVEDVTHIGEALQEAKETLVASAETDEYVRYCYYEINLLGDPEATLIMPVSAYGDTELRETRPHVVRRDQRHDVSGDPQGKLQLDLDKDFAGDLQFDVDFQFDMDEDFGEIDFDFDVDKPEETARSSASDCCSSSCGGCCKL